ncbi:receptor-type tyrosine-protein phosphatase O-like [Mantella aurantiaca]
MALWKRTWKKLRFSPNAHSCVMSPGWKMASVYCMPKEMVSCKKRKRHGHKRLEESEDDESMDLSNHEETHEAAIPVRKTRCQKPLQQQKDGIEKVVSMEKRFTSQTSQDEETSMFQVVVTEGNLLVMSLEDSDLMASSSVYVVKITGESKNYFLQFEESNSSLPRPLVFNASYHGHLYIVTLMVVNSNMASRPAKSVTVLTKPLSVSQLFVHDYKPSPETGVVFEVQYPEKFNVFSRVNISYWEGNNFRSVLYKDFFKGKTVFNHLMPGICYSNITFQLVSEASFNKTTLVKSSGIGHKPQHHRTAPYPPQNISIQIFLVNLSSSENPAERSTVETSTTEVNLMNHTEKSPEIFDDQFESSAASSSYNWTEEKYPANDSSETTAPPYWWVSETATVDLEGFVNEIPPEYENPTSVSFSDETVQDLLPPPSFKVSISWFPPKPPTAFDGFNIYIHKDGNVTLISTVDENTHDFVTQLMEPGKYMFSIRTFSSSGSCDTRESSEAKALSFYMSPDGKWFEELKEKPKNLTVKTLNSTAALVLWTSSMASSSGAIVSVRSLTCQKQKESQRLEKYYCKEVNLTSNVITNLMPGAQYRVVVYLQKAPLIGPPSNPLLFSIEPTGIKDLVLYPLGPSAVVLSWSRPYHSVFRKYVVEMFYFNPVSMTSEWTPYYEIAATISLTSTVCFIISVPVGQDPPLSLLGQHLEQSLKAFMMVSTDSISKHLTSRKQNLRIKSS